ncbi:methyltransferase domain-containing protein [Nocardia sp. CA-135953]|uniref:class I SAM-dependent methyltransferase n=1 Tax=Nocardia sp. CA-135953 TaxID=3239978 RepID=UPI003D98B3B3
MSRNEMRSSQERSAADQTKTRKYGGELVTHVRIYNAIITMFFFGGRGKLDRALVEKSGAASGHQVLDVGAGPGILARLLAERVGPNGHVVGLDPSEPMVRFATKKSKRHPNTEFRVGYAQAIDAPDGAFDTVTATFAMHHVPEEDRLPTVAEMYRVVRPGGRLLIADLHPQERTAYGRRRRAVMQAIDPRRYVEPLREAGADNVEFTFFKPWTGCVVATKPA